MTFKQTTSYSGADIKIGIFRGDHGDGAPFDGKGGVLGHAFAPPDGRFPLDEDEEWAIDGRNLNATNIDMERVVMHEIGHVLLVGCGGGYVPDGADGTEEGGAGH